MSIPRAPGAVLTSGKFFWIVDSWDYFKRDEWLSLLDLMSVIPSGLIKVFLSLSTELFWLWNKDGYFLAWFGVLSLDYCTSSYLIVFYLVLDTVSILLIGLLSLLYPYPTF